MLEKVKVATIENSVDGKQYFEINQEFKCSLVGNDTLEQINFKMIKGVAKEITVEWKYGGCHPCMFFFFTGCSLFVFILFYIYDISQN